jgi:cytochrome oxidase Cu insertion factor (SCO1/SenC/PrrC family)
MAKTLEARSGEHFFLLAAIVAAIAAIFMVTVWAPLQLRAFTDAVAAPKTQAPSEPGKWTHVAFMTADGQMTNIADSNGQVRIVTMLYTHCPGLCPMSVATLQRIETQLTPAQKSRFSVIALTLDPEQDSVARLREFRASRRIDSNHWIIGRPSVEGVRQMASELGVSYRVLDDGTVDHQGAFVLLDKSGRVLVRSTETQRLDRQFLVAVQSALAGN